jgi:hypothetical protein
MFNMIYFKYGSVKNVINVLKKNQFYSLVLNCSKEKIYLNSS